MGIARAGRFHAPYLDRRLLVLHAITAASGRPNFAVLFTPEFNEIIASEPLGNADLRYLALIQSAEISAY